MAAIIRTIFLAIAALVGYIGGEHNATPQAQINNAYLSASIQSKLPSGLAGKSHQACNQYNRLFKAAARSHLPQHDWRLLKAQVIAESNCNPNAESSAGAQGLSQFMPGTWAEVRKELKLPKHAKPTQAKYAIPAQAYYMAKLAKKWPAETYGKASQYQLALAAYNAGPGNIKKAGWDAPIDIAPSYQNTITQLPNVTGNNAAVTTNYVAQTLETATALAALDGLRPEKIALTGLLWFIDQAIGARQTANQVARQLAEKQAKQQAKINQIRVDTTQRISHTNQYLRNATDEIYRHAHMLNRCHLPIAITGLLNTAKTGALPTNPNPSRHWQAPSTPTTATCTNLAVHALQCETDYTQLRLKFGQLHAVISAQNTAPKAN